MAAAPCQESFTGTLELLFTEWYYIKRRTLKFESTFASINALVKMYSQVIFYLLYQLMVNKDYQKSKNID